MFFFVHCDKLQTENILEIITLAINKAKKDEQLYFATGDSSAAYTH